MARRPACGKFKGSNLGLLKAARAYIAKQEGLSGKKLNYKDGADGTRDFDYDRPVATDLDGGRWDINCAWTVIRGLEEAGCTKRPLILSGPDDWEDYDGDKLYPRVPNDKADSGPGDIFYLLRYPTLTDLNHRPNGDYTPMRHMGWITGKATEGRTPDGRDAYIYTILHSYERPTGPTESDRLYVLKNEDKALIVGADGHGKEWTYGGIMRPAYLCRSECMKDNKPPAPSPDVNGRPLRMDPLVIGLDGNGIRTLGVGAGVYFDHDANGFMEASGWVDTGTGVLVIDSNGNGRLDNGEELFGDFAPLPDGSTAADGFEALAYYDANGDGKIDAADPVWSQLGVWEHSNDLIGYSYYPAWDGAMSSLDDLGIAAIGLDSEIVDQVDAAGNTEVRRGYFEWSDGTTGTISEYSFQSDTSDATARDFVEISDDIQALPDLSGYGNVHDLHQAMALDSTGDLKSLVEAFTAEEDPEERNAIMEQLITKWTGAESVEPDSRGPFIDARKMSALENFYGRDAMNPERWPAALWKNIYQQIFEGYYADLMAQTHLKDLYDKLEYVWDEEKQDYVIDTAGVISTIEAAIAADPESGKELLSEFARTRRGMGYFDENCFLSLREHFIQLDPGLGWIFDTGGLTVVELPDDWHSHFFGTDGSEALMARIDSGDWTVNSQYGNDVIYGSDRSHYLINEGGSSILVGGSAADKLADGEDGSILDGGAGHDRLFGGRGNDTYIFRLGSGHDSTKDLDTNPGNTDTIWFGSNLTPEDILIDRVGYDLRLTIEGTDDSLTVEQFFQFKEGYFVVEQAQFMDGTVWGYKDLASGYGATDGDDVLYRGPSSPARGFGLQKEAHTDQRVSGLRSVPVAEGASRVKRPGVPGASPAHAHATGRGAGRVNQRRFPVVCCAIPV